MTKHNNGVRIPADDRRPCESKPICIPADPGHPTNRKAMLAIAIITSAARRYTRHPAWALSVEISE
jgi:hypothetical protein